MVPLKEREGMEGEHTPEIDLTMCHQILEEGDCKFIIEVGQMLFSGSPGSGYTLLVDFLESTEITFGQISLQGREGKLFQSNCLTTAFGVPWA